MPQSSNTTIINIQGTNSTRPVLLVVDDDEGCKHSLRMAFNHDMNVQTVDTGDKAVEYARHNPTHVILMDVRLAGRGGTELIRAFKEIDSHTEVVLMASFEMIEVARQALRFGACDYVSRPFDISTIREVVSRALHLRRISENVGKSTSRLKQLTDQLNDASLREEMARTTNQIYAGVLHDINNPLTIISGYVEMLEMRLGTTSSIQGADLEAVREDIAMIAKQVGTCGAIASRYLRFVGKKQPAKREVSINQILNDIQSLLKNHPAIKKSKIETQSLPNDKAVPIGGTELIQILLNLSINAFQSTQAEQTVRILADYNASPLPLEKFSDSATELTIGRESFSNIGPSVSISIVDQGTGIPADIIPHIFEPYFTTKGDSGTGLGLPIVARLVKAHNGLLNLRTTPGKGTHFTLYFPSKDLATTAKGASRSPYKPTS